MNLVPNSLLRIWPRHPICIQSQSQQGVDMASRVAMGLVFVAMLTACLPPAASPPPPARPVTPQDGPRGSISVDFQGGAYTRQLRPRFRLDRGGYVLVGHLGGDGQIRILYPETPKQSGWVSAGKMILLKPYTAAY